ncbi:MAG: hypothetical protein Q9196_006420 [Gyalolechia fulgens]
MGVNPDELVITAEDMYWTSVHREVGNMLLFFPEILREMERAKAHKMIPNSRNFENMFKVWTGGQAAGSKEFNTRDLFNDVMERARATTALIQDFTIDGALYTSRALILYEDKVSHERSVLLENRPSAPRPILCCVKRIYGAAFSGYPTSACGLETIVLDNFVLEAGKCIFRPSKTVAARRRQLLSSAARVCGLIKDMIGVEVRKYLQLIADSLLEPKSSLTWGMLTNNCQRLIDRILKTKDFEYIFPRLPKGFHSLPQSEVREHFQWPRYLISFGHRIEGEEISIQQPNSCVTKFCEWGSTTGDIIDFLVLEINDTKTKNGNPSFKDLKELALVTPHPNTQSYREIVEDALWDLPRDSLSILQFHLSRSHAKYYTISGRQFDGAAWIDGRLRVLQQLDIIGCFTGALGSALIDLFHREPEMVSKVTIPKSRIFGSLRADEKVRLIRSGPFVTYIIFQRRHSFNKFEHRLLEALQQRLTQHPGAIASSTKVFKILILEMLRTACATSWLSASPDLTFSGIPLLETSLKTLDVIQRDNWIYVHLGKFVIAHQIFKRSKNLRKSAQKEDIAKPLGTQ